MALHAAVTMAFFVDQMQQAQCAIKCPPPAPEPEWKWWFGALAPWVGPLLSGVVSIYVAWKVFRWQGKKDHAQWILDQKKAEWKEILTICGEIGEQCFPPHRKGDTLDMLLQRIQSAYGRFDGIAIKSIFVGQSIDELSTRVNEFTRTIGDGIERLESLRFSRRADFSIPEEYNNLRYAFQSFVWFIRARADLDLGSQKESRVSKSGIIIPEERDRSSQ